MLHLLELDEVRFLCYTFSCSIASMCHLKCTVTIISVVSALLQSSVLSDCASAVCFMLFWANRALNVYALLCLCWSRRPKECTRKWARPQKLRSRLWWRRWTCLKTDLSGLSKVDRASACNLVRKEPWGAPCYETDNNKREHNGNRWKTINRGIDEWGLRRNMIAGKVCWVVLDRI